MNVFITGATGQIGSTVVAELVAAGHEVVGLARSETATQAIRALGASVHRGDLDDLAGLREAASNADGVIHLGFKHDEMFSGNAAAAIADDLTALRALGDALAGSGKPLVGTGGTLGLATLGLDRSGIEDDAAPVGGRGDAEAFVVALAQRGVRASVVRIPPLTHGTADRNGFTRTLVEIARRSGTSGYAGDGRNRWPAVNIADVAALYRRALESAPAGSRLHAVDDEGVELRDIAARIGDQLGIPVSGVPDDRLDAHFGFLARIIGLDNPTSSHATRQLLSWEPVHARLLDDLDGGTYFHPADVA